MGRQQKLRNFIVNLHLKGRTYRDIRTTIGKSRATVQDMIKKFKFADRLKNKEGRRHKKELLEITSVWIYQLSFITYFASKKIWGILLFSLSIIIGPVIPMFLFTLFCRFQTSGVCRPFSMLFPFLPIICPTSIYSGPRKYSSINKP